MALARRLTSLGRAARSEASVKVRQPLARALVFLPADAPDILRDIVADELNVDEIDTADELSEVISFELVPNFRTLGPRLGERVKELQAGAGRSSTAPRRPRHSRRACPSRLSSAASRSSCRPTTCSCASGASRASPSPVKAARWSRSTSPSTTRCARGAWPARSCASCRTCARRAASRCPTGSGSYVVGSRRRRRALRLHRPRGAGRRDRVGPRRGSRARCWSSTTSCSPSPSGYGSRRWRAGPRPSRSAGQPVSRSAGQPVSRSAGQPVDG